MILLLIGMMKLKHLGKIFTVFILSLFFLLPSTYAAWQADGTPVCWDSANQDDFSIDSDGAGNVVIAWWDYRNANGDIYAQRIDSTGVIKWIPNGVGVCTSGGGQVDPQVLCVGNETFIAWQDGNIYAQKLDSTGASQWTPGGVQVCGAINAQDEPQVCSDGNGGIYVAWTDGRASISPDIYAQRLNATGHAQWVTNGVVVCNEVDDQNRPRMISDGSGNAIIAWMDTRGTDWDIYAQKINASGINQWGDNGTVVSATTDWQVYQDICSDTEGGVIIVWTDYRNGASDKNIYAQRLDAGGNPQWAVHGIPVCNAPNSQENQEICADGAGGVVIVWDDQRNGNQDIFAQRVNSDGVAQWVNNGVAVCVTSYSQSMPDISCDNNGNVVVVWMDQRNGTYYDIYGAQIDSAGTVSPTGTTGDPICTANYNQWPPQLINDGAGGAIVVWADTRIDGTYADIYASRIEFASGGIPGFALIYLIIGLISVISIYTRREKLS